MINIEKGIIKTVCKIYEGLTYVYELLRGDTDADGNCNYSILITCIDRTESSEFLAKHITADKLKAISLLDYFAKMNISPENACDILSDNIGCIYTLQTENNPITDL